MSDGRVVKNEDKKGKNVLALLVISHDTIYTSIDISGIGSDTITLFHTTNGGSNWRPLFGLSSGSGYEIVKSIDLHSNYPNIILAGSYTGIWKSTDKGLTWKLVSI